MRGRQKLDTHIKSPYWWRPDQAFNIPLLYWKTSARRQIRKSTPSLREAAAPIVTGKFKFSLKTKGKNPSLTVQKHLSRYPIRCFYFLAKIVSFPDSASLHGHPGNNTLLFFSCFLLSFHFT